MARPLQLIVACAENRVIGRGGRLPWRIPEDTAFFERMTVGATCLLGRISFAGWPRASLDGRTPVVVTRQPHLLPTPTRAAASFADALAIAELLPGEIWVCGGERIYAEALALDRPMTLHLTLVHAAPEGDTWFPEWRHLPWREVARRESTDAGYRCSYLTLERIR